MASPNRSSAHSPHESGVRLVPADQLAAQKQAARRADYESIADGRVRASDARRKNAFLKSEHCREKIDWGAGKLRL